MNRAALPVSGVIALLIIAIASPSAAAATPNVTLSTNSGVPGTKLTIIGAGFPAGEVVALYIDSPGPYLGMPGPIADGQGSFRQDIVWPNKGYDTTGRINPAKPGAHALCADTGYPSSSQPVIVKACMPFQVQGPSAQPSRGSSLPALAQVLIAVGILAALGAGVAMFLRGTK